MKFAARILDIIYPPRCLACGEEVRGSGSVCPDCWKGLAFLSGPVCDCCGKPVAGLGVGMVCETCREFPPAWDQGRAVFAYDATARKLVLGLKHGDRLDTLPMLGRWMTEAGASLIERAEIVAPVPLHWRRLMARRHNQAAGLSAQIAKRSGLTHAPGLLRRERSTQRQSGGPLERRANVASAITVTPGRDVAGRAVLLVDDVLTTGATLSACAEALRDKGASRIDVLVLARASAPARVADAGDIEALRA